MQLPSIYMYSMNIQTEFTTCTCICTCNTLLHIHFSPVTYRIESILAHYYIPHHNYLCSEYDGRPSDLGPSFQCLHRIVFIFLFTTTNSSVNVRANLKASRIFSVIMTITVPYTFSESYLIPHVSIHSSHFCLQPE